MKIAIFSPYSTVAPHFETELEIAQCHMDQGDSVEYISCLGELPNCDFNKTHDKQSCADCLSRRQHGLSLLDKRIRPIKFTWDKGPIVVPEFKTTADLVSHKIDGFDIGYAVLSSLASACRDPDPNLMDFRKLVENLYRSALVTFEFTKQYIQRKKPDRVYCFNGRFAAMRGVLRACEQSNIDCWLHERGCDLYHYELFKNHLPHEINKMHEEISSAWEKADPATRQQTGASWYHDRVNRVERNWKSFVKEQQVGRLPANWNPKKHNVAIFCSSDDEFVAIGDHWKNSLYDTQSVAVQKIVADLAGRDDIHLYVRMHPNIADTHTATRAEMENLTSDNSTVIPPDHVVDTYQLLRSSNVTVSFGSSVGIESVFWQKPSVLLGPSLYQHLPGTYQPKSHDEALQLMTRQDLPAQDRLGAIQYGYWFQTHGIRFQYFEPESLFHGKFKGQVIYAKPKQSSIPRMFRFRAGKFIKALVSRKRSDDKAA